MDGEKIVFKPHLVVSVLGMSKSGKSCLVGNLGGGPLPFYVAQNMTDETDTVHPCFHQINDFGSYTLFIHDLPGNPKYFKNLYRQLCISDVVVITIPINTYKLYQDKTRYFAQLAFIAGITQIVVAITKMDTVQYSKTDFIDASEHTSQLLESIGFKLGAIKFCIPIFYDSLSGNISKESMHMPWYTGNSIYSALQLLKPRKFDENGEFLFSVSRKFKILGVGRMIFGRIISGRLNSRDTIKMVSKESTSQLVRMYLPTDIHRESCRAGDMVSIRMTYQTRDKLTGKTFLSSSKSKIEFAASFKCKIMILSSGIKITEGFSPLSHVHQSMFRTNWISFEKTVSRKSGKTIKMNPDILEKGDVAIIECELVTTYIYLLSFKENQQYGRIVFRDGTTIVAAGVILSVNNIDSVTYDNQKRYKYWMYGKRDPKRKSKTKKTITNVKNTSSGTGRLTKAAGRI